MEKRIWILEDTEEYVRELENIVFSFGFSPVSFRARNPFLRAYIKDENKKNIYGIILDNMFPIYDEPRALPEMNMGIDVIYELFHRDLIKDANIVLYTNDEMNSEIENVCKLGVSYYSKQEGLGWVKDFLGK